MNIIIRFKKAIGIFLHYYVRPNPSNFGYFGKNATIARPCDLKKPSNIYLHEFVRIGPRATIMSVRDSKFIMKRGCLCAEGLVAVTSNHHQHIGKYLSNNGGDDIFGDIIVDEDVWIGINVTLLSNVHVGRGAIIGAGSVVTKDIPPYSIAAGNPAKVVRLKWTIDEILKHESELYPESERYTRQQLEEIRNSLKNIPLTKW